MLLQSLAVFLVHRALGAVDESLSCFFLSLLFHLRT